MKAGPKVSICIPTYNQGQYIGATVESALAQTFSDMEVVVSVDHCTDNTEAVLAQFADPRLRIVRPAERLSMGGNHNFCVANSQGEYFTFLCSDDLIKPRFVEKHVHTLEIHPTVVFSHTAAEIIDAEGNAVGVQRSVHRKFIRPGEDELRRYLHGSRCVASSAMIRRAAFDAVGGFTDYRRIIDWDLWLKLLQVGDVAYTDEVLFSYRDWLDAEGVRQRHMFSVLQEMVDLYNRHEADLVAKNPSLGRVFRAARRKQALAAISWITGNVLSREEAEPYILALSSSWQVQMKLAMVARGFGPAFDGWRRSRTRLTAGIKELLHSSRSTA
jgi:glycosyltransferase involved in cell wall biosynthesis